MATTSTNNSMERYQQLHISRRVSGINRLETLELSGNKIQIRNRNYEYEESLTNLLGIGSYGTVFVGIDNQFNSSTNDRSKLPRKVAIKKIARVNLRSHELNVLKQVQHSNLVKLIDICDADTNNQTGELKQTHTFTYLIMELCDRDLDTHLKHFSEDGCLNFNDLSKVIESVTCGYLALYEKHIVHRDIKPQNILLVYVYNNNVDEQNNKDRKIFSAKITDFGISRVLTTPLITNDDYIEQTNNIKDTEVLSNVAGTFYYMAPEVGANILRISEYNHSADMWSIGCAFYQSLTGNIPFDEGALCRLFLYSACKNYDAYDYPKFPENLASKKWQFLITSLLQINPGCRPNPKQLYDHIISNTELISNKITESD